MAKPAGQREYSWEVRERAEELYICDGLTYEQVAQATGVSLTQIQRWSAADNWAERRREYRQAQTEIRRGAVELRRRLIGRALESLNPQDVYAVARLEAIFARQRPERPQDGPGAAIEVGPDPTIIRTPQEAVAALETVLERKLQAMLSRPDNLTLAALKEVQKCLELVGGLKEKYAEPEAAPPAAEAERQRLVAEVNRLLGIEDGQ